MSARDKQLIDISMNIQPQMVTWPGDPRVVLSPCLRMAKGDKCNMTAITMGLHTGTHVDAPFHFLRRGQTIDSVPLDAMVGPARVIEIKDPRQVSTRELKRHSIRKNELLLFKTKNSSWTQRARTFRKEFVYIPEETARYLVSKKVKTVGVDYLSVGGYKKDGRKVHQHLLSAGIWLIEGLSLLDVTAGRYHLTCLPLKIVGVDGAPARAVLTRNG
ncbi:MAG: cyclase family protein [Candidatus Omnitrophica bacterium]|nr:cyclase family protein [Candidatus Omnitrophota bacterium]